MDSEIISTGTDALDAESIAMLKKRYECPHFRILVIGRANAGKTTILEKVCRVAQGTKPIIIKSNPEPKPEPKPEPEPELKLKPRFKPRFKPSASIKKLFNRSPLPSPMPSTPSPTASSSVTHLTPSLEKGIHDIEDQITYLGSNFIFHDSEGFEAGAREEMEIVWKFIRRRSAATELRDQLHAIWYCIPTEGSRPPAEAELKFFSKEIGGKVPLVVIFTKFDGLIIQEYAKLDNSKDWKDRWKKAEDNAEKTFQQVYKSSVMNTEYPPKAHVQLRDMHKPEMNCPEVTEETANAIDDATLHELFVSTQMNNLDLCVKSALQSVFDYDLEIGWASVALRLLTKFPHCWQDRNEHHVDWSAHRELELRDYRYEQYYLYDDQYYYRLQEYQREITSALFSLFGESRRFSTKNPENPLSYQLIIAICIIARQSFWIIKPFKESIMDALEQFKNHGYPEKIKTQITSLSIPHGHKDDLLAFLYDQIVST